MYRVIYDVVLVDIHCMVPQTFLEDPKSEVLLKQLAKPVGFSMAFVQGSDIIADEERVILVPCFEDVSLDVDVQEALGQFKITSMYTSYAFPYNYTLQRQHKTVK